MIIFSRMKRDENILKRTNLNDKIIPGKVHGLILVYYSETCSTWQYRIFLFRLVFALKFKMIINDYARVVYYLITLINVIIILNFKSMGKNQKISTPTIGHKHFYILSSNETEKYHFIVKERLLYRYFGTKRNLSSFRNIYIFL